jgi:hypothetical protein
MGIAIQSIEDLLSLPVIGWSSDPGILTVCLRIALWNTPGEGFHYSAPLPGLDRSIRIFGQGRFENSVSFPRALPPERITDQLAFLARTEARYPPQTRLDGASASKGWTILTLDEKDVEGNPLVAAYATWGP